MEFPTLENVPPALTPPQRQALSARVRELARQRGMSVAELQRTAGLGDKAVRDIETGAHGPTLSTLLALCAALRLYSVDQLLGPSATRLFSRQDAIHAAVSGRALLRAVDEPPVGDIP